MLGAIPFFGPSFDTGIEIATIVTVLGLSTLGTMGLVTIVIRDKNNNI